MNVNKVILMGNLTRDPEVRALPSGAPVATLGLATNRFWTDKNTGQKQKETEFHNVVVFGRQAEIAKQYLAKGRPVFIEGRLRTRSWQGQDGTQKYKTEVVAERFQLGPRGGASYNDNQNFSGKSQNTEAKEELEVIEYPEDTEDISPENIPF